MDPVGRGAETPEFGELAGDEEFGAMGGVEEDPADGGRWEKELAKIAVTTTAGLAALVVVKAAVAMVTPTGRRLRGMLARAETRVENRNNRQRTIR